jgi:hypothetical protein
VLPIEVVVAYTYPELFGTAEVTYIFPAGRIFLLEDYQEIENDGLTPGMRIRLGDGAIGTVTDVQLSYEPPAPPVRQPDGRVISRVVGKIKHRGFSTVDVTWPGYTATSSPNHPYYSFSRNGYVPAQELAVGEFLLNDKNQVVPVEAVSKTKFGLIELYNVEVEHFHNYYVGESYGRAVLVHNSANPTACINTPVQVAKEVGEFPIPQGGVSIEARTAALPEINATRAARGQKPVSIPERVAKNPSEWYYDPATASYAKRPAPAVDISGAGLKREIPCFPGDVVVATPEGRLPIDEVQIGTVVRAYDEESGEIVTRRVTDVLHGRTTQLVDVAVGSEHISATLKHRFWEGKSQQWMAARDLESGMNVRCLESGDDRILSMSVRRVPEQETFNLTVEGCHNYFVGSVGVLVHNAGEAKYTVYFGYAPADTTFSNPIYIGYTEDIVRRQTDHRLAAIKEPGKYGFKQDIVLRPKIDGLTLDQAKYQEAALYHQMADNGHKWGNLQQPMTKASMNELAARYC